MHGGASVILYGLSDSDHIFSIIKRTNSFYELDLLRYINFALCRRKGFVLDVGANIGNHSVYFAKAMKRKVVCVEPNPEVIPTLQHNLDSNAAEHLIYKCGLGESDGKFRVDNKNPAYENNCGAASLVKDMSGNIPVHTLDGLVDGMVKRLSGQPLVAIKADVEGMEAAVLKGAIGTLARFKPDLFLEVTDPEAMSSLEEILTPLNYKRLYAHAITPVWHFAHTDVLSRRRRAALYVYEKVRVGGNRTKYYMTQIKVRLVRCIAARLYK